MQGRCDRNRNRSKRRAIYCPIHGCYLHSVSQKYPLFADRAEQLQQRDISHKTALLLISNRTSLPLQGEWLEAFWCDSCQETKWYHIHKTCDRTYTVRIAPKELWQQAYGVTHLSGNPSIGEFTQRQAQMAGAKQSKDF